MTQRITNKMVIDAAWELYKDWYQEEGMGITELSKKTGISRWSLTARFKKDGIFVDRRSGRAPKTHCIRGHDLDEFGRQLHDKDGNPNGRECMECKRMRQRVGWNKEEA